MFTSADDDEGKTDVLARLAAALAQRVQGNVLAIDGNSRAPQLAARLGVQSTAGLPEVLAGTASWHDVVRPTAMRGLSVLPGGNGDNGDNGDNTAGLDPAALGTLVAELRNHYRLVLVDAASLLLSRGGSACGLLRRGLPGGAAGLDLAPGSRRSSSRHRAMSGPIARLHRGRLMLPAVKK